MKKQYLSLCILTLFTAVASAITPRDGTNKVAGTYGVCSQTNPSIQLVLNSDGTFHLLEKTNTKKPIDASGTWTMKNKTIRLEGYDSAFPINNKWRTTGKSACLVSRKGLEWTRLCK